MSIEELKDKTVSIIKFRDTCFEKWKEYMWDHTRPANEVHYCREECSLSEICKKSKLDSCELLSDILDVFISSSDVNGLPSDCKSVA